MLVGAGAERVLGAGAMTGSAGSAARISYAGVGDDLLDGGAGHDQGIDGAGAIAVGRSRPPRLREDSLSAAPLAHRARSTGSASSPATTCAAGWRSASRRSAMAARAAARMAPGDGLVYYSPRETLGSNRPLRAFTAIGRVADGEVWRAERGRVPALAAPRTVACAPPRGVTGCSRGVTGRSHTPAYSRGGPPAPALRWRGRSAELTSHRHAHGLRSHARAPARSRPFVPSHPRGRRGDDRAHGGVRTLPGRHPGRGDGPRRAARRAGAPAPARPTRSWGGSSSRRWDPARRALDRGTRRATIPFDAPWHAVRSCVAIDGDRSRSREGRPPGPAHGDLLQAGPLVVRRGRPSAAAGDDREGFSAGSGQFDSDITDGRHPRAALGIGDDS